VTPAYRVVLARPNDPDDLPAIELAAARLLEGQAPQSVLREVTSTQDFRRAQRLGHLWVALGADVPVGFAHVTILEPNAAHLAELDVHPDHGRRGVGTRLVRAVCRWAGEQGYAAVTLTTFRDVPWNMPFYSRLGFEEIPASARTPALQAVLDREAEHGFDRARRVAMRYRVIAARLRPARVDDREALLALWERAVRATHDFLMEQDIVRLRPAVAEELASEALGWWVLEAEPARLVGMLAYVPNKIEGLFIDPDHRGRGGGARLVAHAQRLAGGALAVDVNEQNGAALGFYMSLGFSVVGRSPTDDAGRPFPILRLRREPGDGGGRPNGART